MTEDTTAMMNDMTASLNGVASGAQWVRSHLTASMGGIGFHYLYSKDLEPGEYTMTQGCIAGTIVDVDGE